MRRTSLLVGLLVLVGMVLSLVPARLQAQTNERCFEETTFCISGPIRDYWENNGGLTVFGYPKSVQYEELIEGQPYQVQWFERNRLELHPENAAPYHVQLGRLGAVELEKAMERGEWAGAPPEAPQDGCEYFEQTGYNVCDPDIYAAFRAHGLETDGQPGFSVHDNLALFGYPLTPLIQEQLEGEIFLVQYFERARFEWHPDQGQVLFGLLGNTLIDRGLVNFPHKPYVVANGAMSIELPVHWPRLYQEVNGNHILACMSPDYTSWIVLGAFNVAGMTQDQKTEIIVTELRSRFENKADLWLGDVEEQPDGSVAVSFSYKDNESNWAEVVGRSFYQENGDYMTMMTVYTYAGRFDAFRDT